MKFDANFGEAETIQLKAAILLYGGTKGIRFASVHEPYRDQIGAPYLDAGRPITVDFLRTLAHELGMRMSVEILPAHVLVRTPEITAWWVPAAARTMFFSSTSDAAILNGKLYPHPPLVFCVEHGHSFSVRALFENQRPDRTSLIGVAPYWNTDPGGQVCLGSMPIPGSAGLESLTAWVEGFFRSEFTHSGATKLTRHPQGHFGLWRELAGKDRFPTEWVVPAGTVEEWLCRSQ